MKRSGCILALAALIGALVFTGSLVAHPDGTDPRPALSDPPCRVWGHRIALCWPKLQDVVRYDFYIDQALIGSSFHPGLTHRIFDTSAGRHAYAVKVNYSDGHNGLDTVIFIR